MDSDQECQQKVAENFWREEEQKDEKDFRLKLTMIKLESLKKNSHFGIVLKRRVINNDFFTIYRAKNFIKNIDGRKKIYISFVIRKKVGNAAKRNRIKAGSGETMRSPGSKGAPTAANFKRAAKTAKKP